MGSGNNPGPSGDSSIPKRSHPKCWGPEGHICQKPSGRRCVDCGEPAGTLWGPLWCPDCDVKRLDGISASLEQLSREVQ